MQYLYKQHIFQSVRTTPPHVKTPPRTNANATATRRPTENQKGKRCGSFNAESVRSNNSPRRFELCTGAKSTINMDGAQPPCFRQTHTKQKRDDADDDDDGTRNGKQRGFWGGERKVSLFFEGGFRLKFALEPGD